MQGKITTGAGIIVSLLQNVARVVGPGCRFVRIIVVMATVKDRDQFVHLNMEIQSELYWWSEFVASCNETGIILNPHQTVVDLASNGSGRWGCGAT